jgi:hypothetical protein
MKRLLFVVVTAAGLAACNKPSEDDCRQAITNMQRLLGTDTTTMGPEANQGEIRRCKGGSTREAVACAIKATSRAELEACGLMGAKVRAKAPDKAKAED